MCTFFFTKYIFILPIKKKYLQLLFSIYLPCLQDDCWVERRFERKVLVCGGDQDFWTLHRISWRKLRGVILERSGGKLSTVPHSLLLLSLGLWDLSASTPFLMSDRILGMCGGMWSNAICGLEGLLGDADCDPLRVILLMIVPWVMNAWRSKPLGWQTTHFQRSLCLSQWGWIPWRCWR